MITDEVIKEIYKKFSKPERDESELNLDFFVDLLKEQHDIRVIDNEIVIGKLEEFNPFRRFLKRSLTAVLEFDKVVAFVFRNHILFLVKDEDTIRVHIKPSPKKSFFGRLFGKK